MEIITGIKVIIGILGGYILFAIGDVNSFLILLLFLICVDVFTGLGKAIHNKNITSRKMFKGGYKKVLIFIMIMVGNYIDMAIDGLFLREIIIMYYIAQEGISILENCSEFIPIPKQLAQFFKDMEKESEGEKKNA